MDDRTVTLFLCGDVMLGRGVDQILAHPGDPALREGGPWDAGFYVREAERAHGPIPVPVGTEMYRLANGTEEFIARFDGQAWLRPSGGI